MTADTGYRKDEHKTLLARTKAALRRLDLRARKSLGQHFLIDSEVLEKVASAAELTANDIVIEVGPGLGVLTKELAKQAGFVIAVELDDRLAAILKQDMAEAKNVAVVNEDILRIDPAALVKGQKLSFPALEDKPAEYKVVANLPYYITSAVLRHFLEASLKPRLVVIMVQKEVAEAIVAEPGSMSLLSVSVQFYGKPEIICYVPAESFHPAPEVDSAILRIKIYPQPPVAVDDVDDFFGLVRAGFCAPRKQLANSLAQGLNMTKPEALSLLDKADIIYKRRAETLSIEEWQRLWQIFRGKIC
ncbi:MAG: 16S rRNA (adenine(1518)-N(6)/adenine(1519)-N(6))-dimethyltransferase RsmA [Chloroflexota bacterium]